MRLKTWKTKLLMVGLLTGALAIIEDFSNQPLIGDSLIIESLIGEAKAHFQRGGRGGSRAGRGGSRARHGGGHRHAHAHRTTRRVIRRTLILSSIYRSSLPGSCVRVTIAGALLRHCGDTYYQSSGNQYVVVYVKEVEGDENGE